MYPAQGVHKIIRSEVAGLIRSEVAGLKSPGYWVDRTGPSQ
jgi:hypothetical protein